MDEPTRPPDARADAKLIPMLESDAELAEAMWIFRHPEKGGKKLTFSAILVWLKNEWGVSISQSTLHAAYRWLALKRRWDAAEAMAQQARRELAKDPEISDAELDTFSERVLKAEVATGGDVKSYVSIARLQLAREKQRLDRDKMDAAAKSAIERGLEALLVEIQGNARAMKIFEQLKAEVARA